MITYCLFWDVVDGAVYILGPLIHRDIIPKGIRRRRRGMSTLKRRP